MLPLGYMYKHVEKRPDWIKADQVDDVFSLSGCVSADFAEYINYWRHNGYWLFDSPLIIEELANEHAISLEGLSLFYYEAYEKEYDDLQECWQPFSAEASFVTNIQLPKRKRLEGFDVTTFSQHTSAECSPLSCNSLATSVETNKHCLFRTFEEARDALENKAFENSEQGPFRIIAVYTTDETSV